MVRFLFAAVLAALCLCGCCPRSRGAEPQCTLPPLPQCTLAAKVGPVGCLCPAGGPCTCADGCDCPGCGCASCPGRAAVAATAGIAPTEDEAIRSAALHRCPLVAFVNTPPRSVPGAISYAVRKPGQGPWTWTGGAGGGVGRSATATNDELLRAAAPYLNAAPLPVGTPWQPATYAPQAVSFAPAFGGGFGGQLCSH
jgi:hypothetical protein